MPSQITVDQQHDLGRRERGDHEIQPRQQRHAVELHAGASQAKNGGEPKGSPSHGTNIFAPASTPAKSIADLSVFVLVITGIIFVVCGVQHAKMLIRVSVDGPEDFAAWIRTQQKPAVEDPAVVAGRRVFESVLRTLA
jgi:hypothetical protein